MKFSKTMFGFRPREVISRIESIENEHQQKIAALNSEVERFQAELQEAEKKRQDLQKQLYAFEERERLISDVMITAKVNAQKIEEQARDNARQMLENVETELKQKLQEIDILRVKVARFKEEFREVLDKYRISLEKVKEEPQESGFTPSLITKESKKHEVFS